MLLTPPFADTYQNKMQKAFPINIKRKLLMYGPVKIKSVDSIMAVTTKELQSKKYLAKKKVFLFVFDDTVLITQHPKKGKTAPLGSNADNLVYTFLEAGKISHPTEFDKTKEIVFGFELDCESFLVTTTGEEECKKWIKALQIHGYQDMF